MLAMQYLSSMIRPYNAVDGQLISQIPQHLAGRLIDGIELTPEQLVGAVGNYFKEDHFRDDNIRKLLLSEVRAGTGAVLKAPDSRVDLTYLPSGNGRRAEAIKGMHADDAIFLARQIGLGGF